ncbi:MAG TPA: DNA mismatch repair endonuclease MutL [Candidatus Limiplasma sp.]|nr:DNA mismatch repair endonuclease MutL [Candidatus Limiplasma sp.]
MNSRPIQKLPMDVIGKIAAGEVVERPAAVVKELVENAIDADATAVTVELTDGGITSIHVSDNGTGIPAGQMKMAFERHATSKLLTAEELFSVHTLGFRGEALASIAAVSRVVCTSKTADAEYGMKAQVEAGRFVDFREAASPVGTTILVKDLFYNAPVRLKFLKKPASEAALVSDYLMRLILSRPDIAFRFASQGKTVYRSTGDGKLETAIYAVYGKEAAQAMRRVSGNFGGVLLNGFVGVQDLSRGNRQQQSFFINGRYFRDDQISRALEGGTEGYVMIGRYPICAMNLTMPYKQVDVNVHPNKLEVRFQNPAAVMEAVETIVREALQTETIVERLSTPAEVSTPEAPAIEVVSLRTETQETIQPMPEEPIVFAYPRMAAGNPPVLHEAIQPMLEEVEETQADIPVRTAQSKEVQETMPGVAGALHIRYIGAAFQTYLMFEAGDRLLLIDQHAAHERVLFDRFMARYQSEHVSQRLITPLLLSFPAKDVHAIVDLKDDLEAVGFDLDALDATSVAVRATPVILGESEPVRELLVDVIDDLRGKASGAMQDRIKQRVAQMACKHAIKGGDELSDTDVERLIRQMVESGIQPTCPHGRPIVQEMTRRELEKRFKRIP